MFKRNKDIMMVVALMGIIVAMVLPLPAFALDILLTLSITVGILILMVSVYLMKPLDFSSFPTVLLIVTLFRLSMNIATTRLILLNGDQGPQAAGHLIQSFGQFVVGGNYVVGIIVFVILVLINFMVITKGAGRVAEVSARFTLDALPGKQMSIDADLNSGLITESEARLKRKEISREADFYGAMDGASKFVKGDAVAGIIITIVNVVAGFIIGVVQKGLSAGEAAEIYTILTVGDGLVAQIPSLLISTAAGVIVTRAGSTEEMGEEIIGQLFRYAKALKIVGIILLLMGLVPGFPLLVFWFFGAIFVYLGTKESSNLEESGAKSGDKGKSSEAQAATQNAEPPKNEIEQMLSLDLLELEVGYGVIPVVDSSQGGELLDKIMSIRKQFASDMGIIVPAIHIRDNLELQPDEYVFKLKGVEIARNKVYSDKFMLINSNNEPVPVTGENTTEPAFGLPARWINAADKEKAVSLGFVVVDPATVIATHVTEILKNNGYEILGRDELQKLLDIFKQTYPKVVEELIPGLLPIGTVLRVCKNLLKENVSIKDLRTILETLADYAPVTKEAEYLTEFARQHLGAQISHKLKSDDGSLYVLALEPTLELKIKDGFKDGGSISPTFVKKFLKDIDKNAEHFMMTGTNPVIITSPDTRRFVKRLIEKSMPNVSVVSTAEVGAVKLQTLGIIGE